MEDLIKNKFEVANSNNTSDKHRMVWAIWGLSLAIYYGLKLIADAIKERK